MYCGLGKRLEDAWKTWTPFAKSLGRHGFGKRLYIIFQFLCRSVSSKDFAGNVYVFQASSRRCPGQFGLRSRARWETKSINFLKTNGDARPIQNSLGAHCPKLAFRLYPEVYSGHDHEVQEVVQRERWTLRGRWPTKRIRDDIDTRAPKFWATFLQRLTPARLL